jgi:hypothetical protein
MSVRRGSEARGRGSRRPERGESMYGGGASFPSRSVSIAGGRSKRTRLGVRGVRGVSVGELWPGCTTMSSSSSSVEFLERRPRSSSFDVSSAF